MVLKEYFTTLNWLRIFFFFSGPLTKFHVTLKCFPCKEDCTEAWTEACKKTLAETLAWRDIHLNEVCCYRCEHFIKSILGAHTPVGYFEGTQHYTSLQNEC